MGCNTTYSIQDGEVTGFYFDQLYTVAQKISATCPTDSRLAQNFTWLLSNKAVQKMAGETGGFWAWTSWTAYPSGTIINRLVTWKVPLAILLFQFLQPAVDWKVKTFAILHLVGDPIDTIASLIFTLSICRERVRRVRRQPQFKDSWREWVLILTSLDECGFVNNAETLDHDLTDETSRNEWLSAVKPKPLAACLAADRVTKVGPIVIAELAFIGSYILSYIKTVLSPFDGANPTHIEVHSIAFSLTYISIVTAVTLAAFIGAPQTELSATRLLDQAGFRDPNIGLHDQSSASLSEESWEQTGLQRLEIRLQNGVMPSYRFDRWTFLKGHSTPIRAEVTSRHWIYELTAVGIVISGTLGAFLLSYLVPPDGFECRTVAEASIGLIYLLSYASQVAATKFIRNTKILLRVSMVKDLIFTVMFIVIIIVTQVGILNRSDCWSLWGKEAVHLPQFTQSTVESRLKHIYPIIIVLVVAFQLGTTFIIYGIYHEATLVYSQRDNYLPTSLLWLWKRPATKKEARKRSHDD